MDSSVSILNFPNIDEYLFRCRIIVDIVLNHMVGVGQKSGQNGVGSSGSSSFDGADKVEHFPGVPYGAGGEYKTTEAEAGIWGYRRYRMYLAARG